THRVAKRTDLDSRPALNLRHIPLQHEIIFTARVAVDANVYTGSPGMSSYSLPSSRTTTCSCGHSILSTAVTGRTPVAAFVANAASISERSERVSASVTTGSSISWCKSRMVTPVRYSDLGQII